MNEQIKHIIELQRKDMRIEALSNFLEHFPEFMASIGDESEAGESRVQGEREKLEQMKKDIKRKESKLSDGESSLSRLQAKLNQVKTNKEYEAGLKEIEDRKMENGELEDEIINLYDRLESVEREVAQAEAEWKEKKALLDERREDLERRKSSFTAELESARGEREELASGIKPDFLKHYEKAKAGTGKGVARAEGEVCKACNRLIPAQMYNLVLKGEDVVTCPNCLRILVHLERDIEEEVVEGVR